MKVLWIGGLCWNKNGKYKHPIKLPGTISGSFFQQSMIEGLEENDDLIEITLLSDYPSYSKTYIHGFKWSHNGKSCDITVSSIQVPIISLISKEITLRSALKKLCAHDSFDIIIVYSIHTPYLSTMKLAKGMCPMAKTILIAPDLAQFTDTDINSKPIKRALKKLDGRILQKLLAFVDGYVLFAESMKEKLPIGRKPYTVIEGVFSPQGLNMIPLERKKAIMYAGSIPFGFGIENIVEAFKLLEDPDIELWIFGEGPMHGYLEKASKEDKRIKFRGFVLREELFEYEKKASLLINARNPNDEYTKYSFPSKTFEYLASGTPFLTTRLSGIPYEYTEHLYILENNDPATIKKRIVQIMGLPTLEKCAFGEKSLNFVKKKGKRQQSSKLLDFINSVESNN